MSDEANRGARGDRDRTGSNAEAQDGPLEEQTQPMGADGRPLAPVADDTTEYAPRVAPPIVVRSESSGEASPSPPDLRDPSESDPVPSEESVTEPEPEPEPEPVLEEATSPELQLELEPEPEPEPQVAPPPALAPDEEATLVADPAEEWAGRSEPEPEAPPERRVPQPFLLERVEPSLGRGERLRIDGSRASFRLGRAEENEIRLYTASASREHACIEPGPNGLWLIQPTAGKTLQLDGAVIADVTELEPGMNIVMGQDHLRCVTEGLEREEMDAQTSTDGVIPRHGFSLPRMGAAAWLIAGTAAVGTALLLYAWLQA